MREYVILGCGPAGRAAAREARLQDPDGRVTMVTSEMSPFYLRPALPDLVSGALDRSSLVRRDEALQGDAGVEVRAGRRVYRVFPHESRVLLSDGTSLYFDRLLLATGASPRLGDYAVRLRNKVYTLSTLADAVRLSRLDLGPDAWVAVSGEGHTGLEAVRAFAARGCRVAYLTSHTRFWSPRSSVARSDVLQRLLSAKVEVLFDETVLDILDANGDGYRVITSTRRTLDVAAVCEARRLVPNLDYLGGSGVLVDGGVVVDRELRTNFDNIFSAGDAARVYDADANRMRANFGWDSAAEQGAVAGHNLVHGGGRTVEAGAFRRLHGPAVLERWGP